MNTKKLAEMIAELREADHKTSEPKTDEEKFELVKHSIEELLKEKPKAAMVLVRTSGDKLGIAVVGTGEEIVKFAEAASVAAIERLDHSGLLPKELSALLAGAEAKATAPKGAFVMPGNDSVN